jgi:hypothetical protein
MDNRCRNRVTMICLVVLGLFLVAGCAIRVAPVAVPAVPPEAQAGDADGNGWWAARFKMTWPEEKEPAWYVDAMLAHQVVAPVLFARGEAISLWRFHRRAVRDKRGHQFSFIFYAPRTVARQVFDRFRADARLALLRQNETVSRVLYSDTGKVAESNISDTADSNWSEPVKRTWPYFIMGCSRMWLGLIEEVAAGLDGGQVPDGAKAMGDFYRKVDDGISRIWQEEGRHALLHHLNALYGYGPLVVYEKRHMQF